MPPSLSQLFTVVSRGRTNATPHPLTKLELQGGNRTPISRVSTPGRNHLTTLVNPCWAWSDLGYSYPRHHAALSQILRLFVVFKILSQILRLFVGFKNRVATLQCFFEFATFRTSMHYLETSVTIVITTTSRCRLTCRDSSVLTTYTDWFLRSVSNPT